MLLAGSDADVLDEIPEVTTVANQPSKTRKGSTMRVVHRDEVSLDSLPSTLGDLEVRKHGEDCGVMQRHGDEIQLADERRRDLRGVP